MFKLKYQGMETTMSEAELYSLLDTSNLPWYIGGDLETTEIFIIGVECDITIIGELT